MKLKAINMESTPTRLLAVAAAGVVLLISVFSFIWGFAGTAAGNAEVKEAGDLLAALSPSDPQTHFAAGALHESDLETGDLEAALREYDTAASLAPNNYLLWLRLAAARGRAGDTEGVEKALAQAQKLAPNYSRVQWAVGNFLLREGRDDEAYSQLRKAVGGDPLLAPLAAATSLQMADGDAQAVSAKFENSQPINAALAMLLVSQKRFDEAVEIWNRNDPQDDEKYRETAKQFRDALISNKKFAAAIDLKGAKEQSQATLFEKISNPGFEQPVKASDADAFDWKVTQGLYPQVGVTDTQKASGSFSLIVLMSGPNPNDFRGPSQLIAVQPGAAYDLAFSYKSDVRSSATFFWEIVAGNDNHRIAISQALVPTQNWASVSVPIKVPPEADGIEIRFVRGECAGSICAASGNFWFDDFVLYRK
jgi:tetratricopeptide (TPR) repeat protein